MRPVQFESTLLASARYDATRRHLDVQLHSGDSYRYFGVSTKSYQELLSADSKGRYFNQNIRNRFPYQNLSHPASPVILAPIKN